MKGLFIIFLFLLFAVSSCDLRQREEALQKREASLNQKEQELLLKERTLQLKEEELAKRQQQIDSSKKTDTTHIVNPALAGTWDVKMTCTETTCAGSAVGDTKNEEWVIAYEANTLLAKAMANGQVSRIYSGFSTGNIVELVENRTAAAGTEATSRMTVRLRLVDETHMDGQREIVRDKDCKIVYALQLEKHEAEGGL